MTTRHCPFLGTVVNGSRCVHCASLIAGACQYSSTVNVEGDASAAAALFGVTPRAVELRADRIHKGTTAALFLQHVTGRPLSDARNADFDAAINAEAAYEKWPAASKPDWRTMQATLNALRNSLAAFFNPSTANSP